MPSVNETRGAILDALYDLFSSDRLVWDVKEESCQTTFNDFVYHLDDKGPDIRIWIFGNDSKVVDTFDAKELKQKPAHEKFTSYFHLMKNVTRSLEEKTQQEKLERALNSLRKP